ncbi:MAG: hypothetical protein QG574_4159 [Cyanobacteriota bacterium erpe_2018_sw_21hr_WHONDRS-SW48-000092_B_bin.40]|jgi:hypothetical protein|nr:hypothetical protein [Cyanobacteriota bacterium erpe_2018_sw_21hr_WHONDRS-SW48-000092_B_bin.40]
MSSAIIVNLSTALVVVAAQVALLTSTGDLSPKMVPLQKYGGDPHGPDPHGDDPRDEQHDPGLPANQDRSKGKAPRDVYGGQYPNDQAPY